MKNFRCRLNLTVQVVTTQKLGRLIRRRGVLTLWILCAPFLTIACSQSSFSGRDWRQEPLKFVEGEWSEEFVVDDPPKGTTKNLSKSRRVEWNPADRTVSFRSSGTFGSRGFGGSFTTYTETYLVRLREGEPGRFYFDFLTRDGPTYSIRNLPLTFSRDTGFHGSGEAADSPTPVAVDVSIRFEESKPAHLWTVSFGKKSKVEGLGPPPLVYRFLFSR